MAPVIEAGDPPAGGLREMGPFAGHEAHREESDLRRSHRGPPLFRGPHRQFRQRPCRLRLPPQGAVISAHGNEMREQAA